MRSGLRIGASGDAVKRLHRVLLSAAHEMDRGEVDRGEFGPSTLAALQAFQAEHGLNPTNTIDAATLEMLLRIEETITINVSVPTKSAPPASASKHGIVHGKLVNEDGAPIANIPIELVAQRIRTETPLGKATTDKSGQYSIEYERKTAHQSHGPCKGQRQVRRDIHPVFAGAEVEIDLTTAKDGIVRTRRNSRDSSRRRCRAGDTTLEKSRRKQSPSRSQFLARSIGVPLAEVGLPLYRGTSSANNNKLHKETLYGLFTWGRHPAECGGARIYRNQASTTRLPHKIFQRRPGTIRDLAIDKTLTAAVASNILPASYSAVQQAELSVLIPASRTSGTRRTSAARHRSKICSMPGA